MLASLSARDLHSGCPARIRSDCVSAQLGRDAIRCRACAKVCVVGNAKRCIPVVSGAKILRSQGCARVSEGRAEIVRGASDPKNRNARFIRRFAAADRACLIAFSLKTTDWLSDGRRGVIELGLGGKAQTRIRFHETIDLNVQTF